MDTQLMTLDGGLQGGELSLSRPPETILKEAEMVAGPWSRKVESLVLYKTIGDKKHLYIEAWQMLAAMYRVTARTRETRYVDMGEVKGYEATAEAFHIPTGQIISTADAMCLGDEEKWGPRPKYEYQDGKRVQVGFVATPLQQLRSMAQTRACSKVLSNLFKWVAVQKGYQGTPAEEMTSDDPGSASGFKQPERKQQQQGGGAGEGLISEAQAKRLYAIGMKAFDNDKNAFTGFLASKGYKNSREIKGSDYDAIVALVERGGKAPAPANGENAKPISTEAKLKLWQVASECGWNREEVFAMLKRGGINNEEEITVAQLPEILEALRGGTK